MPFLYTDYPIYWKAPADVSGTDMAGVSGNYGFLLTLVQSLYPEKGSQCHGAPTSRGPPHPWACEGESVLVVGRQRLKYDSEMGTDGATGH